jgi:hypothetical protein
MSFDKKSKVKPRESKNLPLPPLRRGGGSMVLVGKKRAAGKKDHDTIKSVVRDLKDLKTMSPSYRGDDEMESLSDSARLFIDPNLIYKFRLASTGSIQTSVGGVASGYINLNPNDFTGTEYASLSALFDYVRFVRAKLTLIAINPHSDGYAAGRVNAQIFISCDGGKNSVTPGTVQSVIECPNTLCFATGEAKPQHIAYSAMPHEWALTTSPIPGPFAGCYGEFQYYTSGLSISTFYANYLLEAEYEFSSRT